MRKKYKYNKQKTFGYDANGKRIIKWFHADSLRDMEKQIQQYALQLQFAPNASNIRFKDYAEQWRTTYKGNRSKATQDMYLYALKHTKAIDDYPLTKITKTKCQECIKSVWDRPTMAKNVANTLRQVFNTAVQDGMLQRNPALGLDLPKKPKSRFYLIDDKMLKAIKKIDFSDFDKVLVLILRTFGLRPSEALALTVHDFDFKRNILHINKALELSADSQLKDTKTGVSRDIPIPPSVVPVLRSYFKQIRGFYLFTDEVGNLITKNGYYSIAKRITGKINEAMGGNENMNAIPGFTLYAFRHLRASELLYRTQDKDHPISLLQAAELMGHSVNVFLNTYSHIQKENEGLDHIYDSVSSL